MSKLEIWLNEEEYSCHVLNDDTMCDEMIQPAKRHSFIHAYEYKLDMGLFTKHTNNTQDNSCITMNKRRQSCYEVRLKELSEWIGLVDAAIAIYDNSDDELSQEEIIENQITRLGFLLKKQSLKLDSLLEKEEERCKARVLQERLLNELQRDYNKINYLNGKVNNLNSRLLLSNEMKDITEQSDISSSDISSNDCKTTRSGKSFSEITSYSVEKCAEIKQYSNTTPNTRSSCSSYVSDTRPFMSQPKEEWFNVAFELDDNDTSVLV